MFSEEQRGSSEAPGTVPETQAAVTNHDPASAGPSVSTGLMASGDASEPPKAASPVIEASDESAVGSSVSEAAEIRNLFESMDRLSPIAAGRAGGRTGAQADGTRRISGVAHPSH